MATSNKRTRATAEQNNNVGTERYLLFKQAYSHINKSLEEGFYLEAITIIESLVSDRLESRLTYLKEEDFSFKNLGTLITHIKSNETDEPLKKVVANELDSWRKDRNRSLHEMAKKADGDASTWENRMEEIEKIAKRGLVILRNIDSKCTKLRKKSNSC